MNRKWGAAEEKMSEIENRNGTVNVKHKTKETAKSIAPQWPVEQYQAI